MQNCDQNNLHRFIVGKLLLNYYKILHVFTYYWTCCEICPAPQNVCIIWIFAHGIRWCGFDFTQLLKDCFVLYKLLCMYFLQPAIKTYTNSSSMLTLQSCCRVCYILLGCMGLLLANNNTVMNPMCPIYLIAIISWSFHYIYLLLITVSI